MRFQSHSWKILLVLLLSFNALAATDKEMQALFGKYDQVMNQQKVELVDEVFTKEFLEGHGGRDQFVEKVKTLPYVKEKKGLGRLIQKLKKSKVGKFFSVKSKDKGAKAQEFIVKEEDGKLKIDGTVGDG